MSMLRRWMRRWFQRDDDFGDRLLADLGLNR